MGSALAVSTVLLSFLTLAGPPPPSAGGGKAAPAAPSRTTLTLSFKLDPRLAGPTYGGERWVSPRTYTGASAQDTVEVRAVAVDARGRRLKLDLEWTVSDPETVTVSPPRGERVRIEVKRAGESVVTVKAGEVSRSLTVRSVEARGLRQVIISQ